MPDLKLFLLGAPRIEHAGAQITVDTRKLLGEYGAALRSYETAAALCPLDALAPIERRLADIYRRRGEWDRAESHLQAALDALGEQGSAVKRAALRRLEYDGASGRATG